MVVWEVPNLKVHILLQTGTDQPPQELTSLLKIINRDSGHIALEKIGKLTQAQKYLVLAQLRKTSRAV